MSILNAERVNCIESGVQPPTLSSDNFPVGEFGGLI
jgi:hypothetical protein